jgi:hypothetical protein
MMKKPRIGDIVVETVHYKTLGDSQYTGIVYSTDPLFLFPYTGKKGGGGLLVTYGNNVTHTLIRQPLCTRIFNAIITRVRMAIV